MSTLKEKNKKAQERAVWGSPEIKALRESTKKAFGADMRAENFLPKDLSDFSYEKFREKAMREGISASTFPQLLRAGVQTYVNQLYQTVPDTYSDWVHVAPSDKDTELYAPLHGITFLGEVGPQEKFIEANMAGLDIKLKNRKFGQMFVVEHELDEDDQTAQIQQMVGLMAEYAKLAHEVYCYGKLASVANMSYSNLTVPTSETKPSTEANYPWTTTSAPFVGGGFNTGTSQVALTQPNIQIAMIQLYNQLNLLGLKMNVEGKRLIIAPHYRFDAAVLLSSAMNPAGASSSGVTGGAFSINPIQNVVQLTTSRFVFDQNGSVNADSKAWYIVDDSKPFFVAQIREAASVLMEQPTAGASFDRDLLRWKLRLRFNADWIDPRFAYRGSDGSV